MIEPLRPLIDNWLLGCFRSEILRVEHFSTTEEGCFLGKAGRVHFYQAYEKQVANWRKILTENCFDLVKIFKECRKGNSPQRREKDITELEKTNWNMLLESYYFNQRTMLADWVFNF